MLCANVTAAKKRYQRAVYRWMAGYAVILFSCVWLIRHESGHKFLLYLWSVLPALPILGVMWEMSRYLRDETDEFQRWQVTQSILAGAAALLAAVTVNDFLRAFADSHGLPPFALYMIFFVAVGAVQLFHKITNRVSDE
jgi:hypothetical protein